MRLAAPPGAGRPNLKMPGLRTDTAPTWWDRTSCLINPEKQGTEMITTTFTERRELAHRISNGIDVRLFWGQSSNRVTIAVFDSHSDEALEFEVDARAALDAFKHPYAYAATRQASHLAAARSAATARPRS